MMICVINKSTLVTNDEAHAMALACDVQIHEHVSEWWNRKYAPVVYALSENWIPAHQSGSNAVIAILDDPDQADALGWHTEGPGGQIYGEVFARPVLDNGGTVLGVYSSALTQVSVSSVLSHEVVETFGDSSCNLYADNGSGTCYAVELCDAVEGYSYPVPVRPTAAAKSQLVMVSNFLLPNWFDPNSTAGKFASDYQGICANPFQIAPAGYSIQMADGAVSAVFGEEYPEWRKEYKRLKESRPGRRLRVTE